MTGADEIVAALTAAGVDTCFMNPGTSEMHLVAALSRASGMRNVLCLFEGVASGAADGYARAAGRPAAVLLHLGPGYANAAANLHNARRARSPVVVLVGDHTNKHRDLDPPLASDIAALARTTSKWVCEVDDGISETIREAVHHSMTAPRGVATVTVPADRAWDERPADAPRARHHTRDHDLVDNTTRLAMIQRHAATAQRPAVLLGGSSLQIGELEAARSLSHLGYSIYSETFPACQDRGRGIFEPARLPYAAASARQLLKHHDVLYLVDAPAPIAFFAYPDDDGILLGDDLPVVSALSCRELIDAIPPERLAAERGVEPKRPRAGSAPDGVLQRTAHALSRHLPTSAIVSDDAVTAAAALWEHTAAAEPHRWMTLTGGAIGQAMPVAIGAAIAAPSAKVVALTGDGAAMYTVQSLWTMARENLNVLVVVFANRSYRILEYEFEKTGAGDKASGDGAFRLDEPVIDWCALAQSMGVAAMRVTEDSAIDEVVAAAMAAIGPFLLEVVTP